MHRHGDFASKWELLPQFKVNDPKYMDVEGEAPEVKDSDVDVDTDMKSEGEDDFEDV